MSENKKEEEEDNLVKLILLRLSRVILKSEK